MQKGDITVYRKIFLIPILTCIFAITLATNSMARIQPYIGLGANQFNVDSESEFGGSELQDEAYYGTAGSYSLGVVLNENKKLNLSYFMATAENTAGTYSFDTTLIGLTYDHCFNNLGEHQGFYVGAGIASIAKSIEATGQISSEKAPSDSAIGFLARIGFEHKTNDNILLDISYNISKVEMNNTYYDNDGKSLKGSDKTTVGFLNVSINFLF